MQQLVRWFEEAFKLPVLELEEVEKNLAKAKKDSASNRKSDRNISLQQVIADLDKESDMENFH